MKEKVHEEVVGEKIKKNKRTHNARDGLDLQGRAHDNQQVDFVSICQHCIVKFGGQLFSEKHNVRLDNVVLIITSRAARNPLGKNILLDGRTIIFTLAPQAGGSRERSCGLKINQKNIQNTKSVEETHRDTA